MKRLPGVLAVSSFLAACGGSSSSGPPGPLPPPPPGGSCGLANPAFCETFDAPSQVKGERSGVLDPARFGVSRATQSNNPPQNMLENWDPGTAIFCGVMTSGILPGNDFAVCNGQLNDSFDDGGNFAFHSTQIRQPFDFTGRTGTIVFDVDDKAIGHAWWTEVWMSDEPVAAPYQTAPGIQTLPHNGFGLQLLGDFCAPMNGGLASSVHDLFVVQNHQLVNDYQGGDFLVQNCFATQDQVLNHFELKVSQTHLELWATDAGNPSSLHQIISIDGIHLPLTRGYVNFQHTHYNAEKVGQPGTQTYRWDNLGFDGPVLAPPRVYEVPDGSSFRCDGSKNIGYDVPSDGSSAVRFSVDGVDLSYAKDAWLHFTINDFVGGADLKYRVNGGAWHDYPQPDPSASASDQTLELPVSLAELVPGTNTFDVKGTACAYDFVLANVDLAVETN